MIEFEALAMKMDTDKLYTIFFAEEECMTRHNQNNTRIPTYCGTSIIRRVYGQTLGLGLMDRIEQ